MKGSEGALQDDERAIVLRMFDWLVRTVQKVAPELQVIVLEHADLLEGWYQDRVVERWRDGITKLVPLDWLESDGGNAEMTDKVTSIQPSLFDLF